MVIFNNEENETMALIIHKAKKINSLAILNFHKNMTDEINFVEVGDTFISSHENRLKQFGKLLLMMNCELFIYPNNNFFISF